VHRIEMPVDVFEIITEIVAAEIATAAVKSELKMFVAQQVKTMGADFIGLAENLGCFVRQMFAQQLRAL